MTWKQPWLEKKLASAELKNQKQTQLKKKNSPSDRKFLDRKRNKQLGKGFLVHKSLNVTCTNLVIERTATLTVTKKDKSKSKSTPTFSNFCCDGYMYSKIMNTIWTILTFFSNIKFFSNLDIIPLLEPLKFFLQIQFPI